MLGASFASGQDVIPGQKNHAVDVSKSPDGLELLTVTEPELDATFEVYGDCPVQAFGTVLGRDLYFRARNNCWSFDVAEHAGNLPSDGFRDSDG
jgi:hypothetical protein